MATNEQVISWLTANPTASDAEITAAAKAAGVSPAQLAAVTGLPASDVIARMSAVSPSTPTITPSASPAPTQLNANQQLTAALQAINSGNAKLEWRTIGSDEGSSLAQVLVGSDGKVFEDVQAKDLGGGNVQLITSAPSGTGGNNPYVGITTSVNPNTGVVAPVTSQNQVAIDYRPSKDNSILGLSHNQLMAAGLATMGGLMASGTTLGAAGATEAGAAGANTVGSTMLDYSMPSAQGGIGLQGTAALDGTLASGLAAPAGGSLGGGLGLNAATAGNLAAMGGAQGLLANAAGGGALNASGVNTGLFTAANLTPTAEAVIPPTTINTATNTVLDKINNLTPVEIAQLAKAGISVAGLVGAAKAASNLGGGTGGIGMLTQQQDRSGISSGTAQYSPEYYQAIQAKYNQMMPQQPRDVTTDLKSWYETKYAPKVTQ